MKKIIILLSIVLINSSCSIFDPHYNDFILESKKIEYKPKIINFDSISNAKNNNVFMNNKDIYSINSDEFKKLLSVGDKEYYAVVFQTFYCRANRLGLPSIVFRLNQRPELFTFIVSGDDWVRKNISKSYMRAVGLDNNFFMLDVNKYGDSRSYFYRWRKFAGEITTLKPEEISHLTVLLFNKNGDLLLNYEFGVNDKLWEDIDRILEKNQKK